MKSIDLADKLRQFNDLFAPKVIATFNDNEIQLVKVSGDFVWHTHDDTDDFFLVLEGHLTIQLRDGNVDLEPGQLYVVPRGVEHCPRADVETHVLLIERRGTPNTGDAGGPLTARREAL
jgi:mannose-6-phosphate isomerase-like protein (cupin superfamily)